MKLANTNSLICATLLFLSQPMTAQHIAPSPDQPLTTNADSLRSRGIDLSRSSLIVALSNGDPQVRWLAASQLVGSHDLQATRLVESALSTETNTQAKVQIAFALAYSGDPVGVRHLEGMCLDVSLPMYITAQVARNLAMVQASHPLQQSPVGKCADALLAALDRTSEHGDRLMALQIFHSIYQVVSESQVDHMVAHAENLLGDSDTAVRTAAGDALATMGSTSSIELIRRAILLEEEPTTRSSLQRDLQTLEKPK